MGEAAHDHRAVKRRYPRSLKILHWRGRGLAIGNPDLLFKSQAMVSGHGAREQMRQATIRANDLVPDRAAKRPGILNGKCRNRSSGRALSLATPGSFQRRKQVAGA